MLHLPGAEAPGGAGKPEAEEPAATVASRAVAAAAAAAPGAGMDAECCACGHLLCWRCGEEAHEPASCGQVGS